MNKEQGFLLVVLALAGLASLAILLPFLEFVLLAIILAYVLYPLNAWVEPHLGRQLSPAAVITGAVVELVVPLAYIGLVLYRDLQRLAAAETEIDIDAIESWIAATTGQEVELAAYLETVGRELLDLLFGDVTALLSTVLVFTIGILLVFFLVYYLLREGEAFVEWLVRVAPADDAVSKRLVDQIDRTTHG